MAPEAKVIAAASYHEAILELRGPLAVQAVFSRAWHLRHTDGWMMSISNVPYDGPLGIRVIGVALEKIPVHPGMSARLTSNGLQIGSVRVALSAARIWRPGEVHRPRPLGTEGLHRAVSELQGDGCRIGEWDPFTPGPTLTLKERIPAQLLSALINDDLEVAERGAYSLLGRGPGLTPAGDDFLCGLLVGLRALGTRLPSTEHWTSVLRECMGAVVDRHAATRTTALSRTLLHYAQEGVSVQPLLDVVHTVGSDRPFSGLEALLRIGHSSGRAMLAGAILAFRAGLERGSTLGSALVRPA